MQTLIDLIEQIENSGAFSVAGKLTSTPPALKVKGLGIVSLPVIEYQAKKLIALSEQAPYGHGEETIVDKKVRNTWQISSENFSVTNPQWLDALQESVNKIGQELGLHHCKINFDPYKLLIYEKGSFFTPHRDTEKIPNMFATLVINLPSEYEGGELIISHDGQRQQYSFAANDGLHPDFAAFYADCYHEIRPISSGYRICLIYNLAIANRKKQPLLSDQFNISEQVGHFIAEWVQKKHATSTLTYLLEHSYSESSLRLANLKNGDFAKASVLLNAAEKNNCHAFLCLVTYYRSSYGETAYYERSSYYGDDDNLDENDFQEYDVSEEEIYAHDFIDSEGKKTKIGKLFLEENELLAKIPLLEGKREFSISEATGNEGATKDLWYHRGAIIIWSEERNFEMIGKTDIDYQVNFFKNFVQEHDLTESKHRKEIIQLADNIIEKQKPNRDEDIYKELMRIGDVDLLKKFVFKKVKSHFSYIKSQAFIEVVEFCGWQHFEQEMTEYLTPQRDAVKWLASLLGIESLSLESKNIIKKWFSALWKPSLEYNLSDQEIGRVLYVLVLLKLNTIADEIIAFLSLQTKPSFYTDTYALAILTTLKKLNGLDYDHVSMDKIIARVSQRIQADFPSPPVKPKDLSREGKLQCSCTFCTKINKFLPDPEQSEISFNKTLKRNLTHIESEIRKSRVELSLVIIKSPPKFDGVCRKNEKNYDRLLALFTEAQHIVHNLQREQ